MMGTSYFSWFRTDIPPRFAMNSSKLLLSFLLVFLCAPLAQVSFAKSKLLAVKEPTESNGKAAALGSTVVKGSKRSVDRSAWCHAVVNQPFPEDLVSGTIGGKPFKPDVVQWNSYSITLKQSKKRYCKVVVNMMMSQKPLCKIAFTSDSNDRPHIYVYSRSSNSEPVVEQHYTNKDHYGLKFSLLALEPNDRVPGSLSLRLPDGGFVSGRFTAEKAPRVIWDDQTITP